MSLEDLSYGYVESAMKLRRMLRRMREQIRREQDPAERLRLQRQVYALEPILTEMNTLAELTARYYERGFYRDADYTL